MNERRAERENENEREKEKERKRARVKMREKRSLKKVAAMGPSDGRRQSLSFSVFKAIFRSRSRSRVSRETLEPSPVLSNRFVKGVSRKTTRRRALSLWSRKMTR